MSPHGIAGRPDESSPNSGNTCHLARPLTITLRNFVALGETMYEKSVTKYFYTLQFSILATRGTSGAKVHQSQQ